MPRQIRVLARDLSLHLHKHEEWKHTRSFVEEDGPSKKTKVDFLFKLVIGFLVRLAQPYFLQKLSKYLV